MNELMPVQEKSVKLQQRIILGFGFLAIFFSHQGLSIFATPYYQMTLGVDPMWLALGIKLPAIVVIFFAPYIGNLSDICRSRYGRRRPFLMVFPWLSCVCFGCIWMVPTSWSINTQVSYFLVMVTLFYFANSLWVIPLKCLTYEASTNSQERTSILAFVAYFFKFGGITYQWLFPLAQLSIFGGVVIGIKYVGWGIALICIGLFGMLPGLFIKERSYKSQKKNKSISIMASIKAVLEMRNMRILLLIIITQFMLGSLAANIDYYVLVYYMNDGDIAQGAISKGILSSSYAVMGFVSVAVITKLSAKYGKRQTLIWVYTLGVFGGIMKWFIYQPGQEWFLILDALLCVSVWPSLGVLVSSMITDLIDSDEKKHDLRREGIFVSVQMWTLQITIAISAIFSGAALNWIGFDAELASAQTDSSIMWMRILLAGGTILSALICLILAKQYDLDERKV
ncbi:hypothetical protein A3Q33_17815 [Colwellia sp. PAMC 21821]|nr:hypothetical protein A3Q33_17815 [Colwellia sp. PAMC 21821]